MALEKLDGEKQLDEDLPSVEIIEVNASGHVDQLNRQYGLLSICATAINIDGAWIGFGGSISTAILNGGPPGIMYELLAACFYYGFIAASLAELASSVPSTGGVYHWACVTPGPRWGRSLGFFAGVINFFAYIFGLSSSVYIVAEAVVQMWALFRPDFVIQAWHTYVTLVLIAFLSCATVIFLNALLPAAQKIGGFITTVGGLVTIITVVVMPRHHASHTFVWTDWVNRTGWSSGTAFLTGMLNGAFTIGTPDAVTHFAEELPRPRIDLPRAIASQMVIGTIWSFIFGVALLYGVSDLDAIINSSVEFPLTEAYIQATSSKGATFGLLLIIVLAGLFALQALYAMCGRLFWALARDNVTPFATFFSQVSPKLSCPVPATIAVVSLSVVLAAISLGSKTAFSDLAGSFCILSATSYLIPIAGHLLTGRRHVPRGPFWMGQYGYFINAAAVAFIIFTDVIFCLPFSLPTTAKTLNYNSVILVGCFFLTTGWWLWHGLQNYAGPTLPHTDEVARVLVEEK